MLWQRNLFLVFLHDPNTSKLCKYSKQNYYYICTIHAFPLSPTLSFRGTAQRGEGRAFFQMNSQLSRGNNQTALLGSGSDLWPYDAWYTNVLVCADAASCHGSYTYPQLTRLKFPYFLSPTRSSLTLSPITTKNSAHSIHKYSSSRLTNQMVF